MSGAYCERCGRLLVSVWYREKNGSVTREEAHICTNPETGWIGVRNYDALTGKALADA